MTIRSIIVDDHAVVREGLRVLLDQCDDLQVVAVEESGAAAVDFAQKRQIDVAVIDVTMSGMSGVETTRNLLSTNPKLKVVALSMHSDHGTVDAMLNAGAAAYVNKASATDEIAAAIRCVIQGSVYLGASVAPAILEGRSLNAADESRGINALTPREHEIFLLLADGQNARDIASSLGRSVKTIEIHRRRVMKKLNVDSVADLTKLAIRHGFTSLR
jgi:DNA-binding NarL/FixJ family response regulator